MKQFLQKFTTLWVIIFVAAFAVAVFASTARASSIKVPPTCFNLADQAAAVMSYRQIEGNTFQTAVKSLADAVGERKISNVQALAYRNMYLHAFEDWDLKETTDEKALAIAEFADEFFNLCLDIAEEAGVYSRPEET